MDLFRSLGNEISYNDILELDGAVSITHINYGNSPKFNGFDGRNLALNSRIESVSAEDTVELVTDKLFSFNGTEKAFSESDRLEMWKAYWEEYISAFDKQISSLPESIVTMYVGRHAIELGFKYLLLKRTGEIIKSHNLEELASETYYAYSISEEYMDDVVDFCRLYGEYIEGGNVEYFRYPEYKKELFFAGNKLSIGWLAYNMAIVLLKLIHFANLDDEM